MGGGRENRPPSRGRPDSTARYIAYLGCNITVADSRGSSRNPRTDPPSSMVGSGARCVIARNAKPGRRGESNGHERNAAPSKPGVLLDARTSRAVHLAQGIGFSDDHAPWRETEISWPLLSKKALRREDAEASLRRRATGQNSGSRQVARETKGRNMVAGSGRASSSEIGNPWG